MWEWRSTYSSDFRFPDLGKGGAIRSEDLHFRNGYWGKNEDAASRCRLWTEASGAISETSQLHATDDVLLAAMGRG